jgi:hypothetical protein
MASWRARDPVVRFRNWLVSEGWWDEAQEKEARRTYRQQVRLHGRRGMLCNRNCTPAVDWLLELAQPASIVVCHPTLPWHLPLLPGAYVNRHCPPTAAAAPPLQVMAALDEASQVEKPALSNLFTDVYAEMPWHLREQMQATMDFAKRHPEVVPQGVPVK